MVETELKRNPGHRFQPGHAKAGGRKAKLATVDEMVAMALPSVAEKVIEAAMNGDVIAGSALLTYAAHRRAQTKENS
jgi:hypothetical protein